MNSAPEEHQWVICPICYKPNRSDRRFCEYCGSARLRSVKPVSYQEMQAALKQHKAYLKRRRSIKVASITLGPSFFIIAVVLIILLTCTDVLAKPPQALNSNSLPGDWAMFRHDLLCSGASDTTDVLPQGEVQWTFVTNDEIRSSPAVVNGTVYIGSRDGKFYAVEADTGLKKWEFQPESGVDTAPAIVAGVVYFGSNDGNLYALEADTGKLLWFFQTLYAVRSSPAVVDGVVYFGSYDGVFYALDAVTGEELWQFETPSMIQTSPVLASGIVYFGSGSSLYALDARNGALRLRFDSYNPVASSPAVSDRTVYFGNFKGVLYAVDGYARNWPLEHELRPYWYNFWLWGLPVPELKPQSGSMWGVELRGLVYSSPAVAGGQAYVGVDNALVAIDVDKEEILWLFETDDLIKSSPTVVGNTVYIGSNDGRLYALDATSGQKLWDITTGGPVSSSAALADGTLYFGSYDGKLYAIR